MREIILAIELLAAAQAYDLQPTALARAPRTESVYRAVRKRIPHYARDRPLAGDIERAREILARTRGELGDFLNAPAAVDGNDLAGDVGRVFGEEQRRAGDVLRACRGA